MENIKNFNEYINENIHSMSKEDQMKYYDNIRKMKEYDIKNFTTMTSNQKTENEKYDKNDYIIYDVFKNDAYGSKPYRFVGLILDTYKYNTFTVSVIKQLKHVYLDTDKKNNLVKDNNYEDIEKYADVHIGNIVSKVGDLDKILTRYA